MSDNYTENDLSDEEKKKLKELEENLKIIKEEQVMPVKDKLQDVLPFLFYYEPFFADVFRYINKIKSMSIPTAGVRVNKNAEIELIYNPRFLNSKNISEIYFIMKHEIYHILLNHIFERMRKPLELWNICTDSVINLMIYKDLERLENSARNKDINFNITKKDVQDLMKELVFPDKLYNMIYNEFGSNKSYRIYNILYEGSSEKIFDTLLQTLPENLLKKISAFATLDEHLEPDQESEQLSEVFNELAKEKFKKQIEEIVNEAKSRCYGNVPYHLQSVIDALLAKKTVDWRILLNYFIKQTIKGHKYHTIRKINKRFPYIYSGSKHRRYARILVGMDESGSMSNDLINELFSEIKGLSEVVQFDVLPFDYDINEKAKFTWKKGQKINQYKRSLAGGTSFEPVTKYASENHYDGLIIVTDCGAPFPPSHNVRRMWLTSPEYLKYCSWRNKELVVAVKKE